MAPTHTSHEGVTSGDGTKLVAASDGDDHDHKMTETSAGAVRVSVSFTLLFILLLQMAMGDFEGRWMSHTILLAFEHI